MWRAFKSEDKIEEGRVKGRFEGTVKLKVEKNLDIE